MYLSRRVLDTARPSLAFDAICHELAHIVHSVQPTRIRCWETEGHEQLTFEACGQFAAEFDILAQVDNLPLNRIGTINALKHNCSNLDHRGRVHPLNVVDTLRYILGGQFLFGIVPSLAGVIAELPVATDLMS